MGMSSDITWPSALHYNLFMQRTHKTMYDPTLFKSITHMPLFRLPS
jgi:hypothetical protein